MNTKREIIIIEEEEEIIKEIDLVKKVNSIEKDVNTSQNTLKSKLNNNSLKERKKAIAQILNLK